MPWLFARLPDGPHESGSLDLPKRVFGASLGCLKRKSCSLERRSSRRLLAVLRVEMQSMKNDPTRPAYPTIISTFTHIVKTLGVKGLFRGPVPRIGVAAWATIRMVGFGDTMKELLSQPS